MNSTNSILLKGKEKEIYQGNLVESLVKMENYEDRDYLVNLIGLFDIYGLCKYSSSTRYDSLAINTVTGFPETIEVKKLMKDKKTKEVEENKKEKFYTAIARYFDPFFIISLYNDCPLEFYSSSYPYSWQKTQSIAYFFDAPNEKRVDLRKKDWEFYWCLHPFYYSNRKKQISHTFKADEKEINQTPKYITTFLDYCLERKIMPDCIEKEEYTFLDSNSQVEEEYPQLNVLLKENPETYILKKRNEKLCLGVRKGFGKLEKRLEKELTEREIYACHQKIFDRVFDILGYDDNIEII